MENGKVFKTKTGFCHVLPDKILLTRDGIIGNISNITVGNGISRILIIYSIVSIFLLHNSLTCYQKGENVFAIFFGLIASYLIYGIIKSINNSATPIIERNRIKKASFFNAKLGLTRARFEILFEDDNGKLKKGLIILPGSLNDGQNETEKALTIMKSEGILK